MLESCPHRERNLIRKVIVTLQFNALDVALI